MSSSLVEGNLRFEFSTDFEKFERFDCGGLNGLLSVDFVAETPIFMYFIEVKDYQDPSAPKEQRDDDFEMLVSISKGSKLSSCQICKKCDKCRRREKKFMSTLPAEIGQKLKDSLLRKYARGEPICKNVVYLLLINLSGLDAHTRGRMSENIHNGHIPVPLSRSEYSAFSKIDFKIVDADQIKTYGINCTAIN